jgi:hypothetical protein
VLRAEQGDDVFDHKVVAVWAGIARVNSRCVG